MVTLLKSQAIFDVDTQTTFAGSIAVDGQKITAIYREPVDEAAFDLVRNFGDQMILPGFVDAHQHTYVISLVQAGALTPIDYGTVPEVLAQLADVAVFSGIMRANLGLMSPQQQQILMLLNQKHP